MTIAATFKLFTAAEAELLNTFPLAPAAATPFIAAPATTEAALPLIPNQTARDSLSWRPTDYARLMKQLNDLYTYFAVVAKLYTTFAIYLFMSSTVYQSSDALAYAIRCTRCSGHCCANE